MICSKHCYSVTEKHWLTFTDYFACLKFGVEYYDLGTFWHYVITCPRFEEVGVYIILSNIYQEKYNSCTC